MVQKIDVSKARNELPKLMEKVYFEGLEFILLRRGIPMAVVSGINKIPNSVKVLKTSRKKEIAKLFGIWKKKKGSTVKIANELREMAWKRHAH